MSGSIHIGCIYIPPAGTTYVNPEIGDYFLTLEQEISKFPENEAIVLCGDFNARTGTLTDHMADNYIDSVLGSTSTCNQFERDVPPRMNDDKNVNSYGKNLIELCCNAGFYIMNRRGENKTNTSGFTCFSYNGKSAVDYLIANS